MRCFDKQLLYSYYAAMKTTPDCTELISEMIGLIYEAAADLSLWPQLLENISDYLELSLPDDVNGSSVLFPVSHSEYSLTHILAPHFERANSLHKQLAEVTDERNLLESVMNRLPLGAAIIDAQCNTISLNRTIISLLQGNALLKLTKGRLVSSPSDALHRAVEKVLSGKVMDEVIRLVDGETNISLWITRGDVSTEPKARPGRLLVFVASRTSHALSEQGLIELFAVTPAEARVVQKLALGHTLDESAELLKISLHTAKTHLARIFKKIGVKRQAELMQAIYASPLWLTTDPKLSSKLPLTINGVNLLRRESEEQRIRLTDGRWLYFSDSGDPQGRPVIFMHGIAGSRYLRHPDDDILMQEGIRLIIPERPGNGDSDPQANRLIANWPQDITELADYLGLKHFSVLGYSGGTAYALAVAAAMPERILTMHLIAAVSPLVDMEDFRAYNPVFRMTLFIARYTPGLLPALMRVMVKDIRTNVYQYLEKLFVNAPELDREVMANPRLRANIATGLRASVRHDEHEIALEVLLAARDWQIDLTQITMPVHIWYGEKDPLVSHLAAKNLAELLPNTLLTLIPEAGHYLLYTHWQDILHSIKTVR